ncbi:MAG: FAD-binding oxidoreductase, partial [Phycisphaerae bacterium]|nr:FAD-binding oxidoreductase [Phycisphaerae bacterium]NIP51100.1 FAD-binding oxidoreductase [Phycisphaerae bacterium]NIW97500.1 FAD-binding protein [Phycisphaerae bacterium]NIX27026.1 FAD-binding protein [Phycisphaerae bacterium]
MAHSLTDTVYTDLEASLKNKISGEVYFDQTSKILYSTDASNYQIEPIGVVVPKNEDDISQIIDIASSYEVAILPRGSGTSLAGQAVGHSLVVDLSKYLDRVINVSREEKIVRVQSGMFLESLNRELKPYGLMFGPDPSSAKVATIGGVVANNATGAHSILYGMAGDNVEACKLYMDKAEQVELGKTSGNTLMEKLNSFKEKHSVLIESDFPKHWRRASGYSLNYFIGSDFNPAKLLAGSEGTLGLAAEFTLNLVERPQYTGLAVLQFKEIVSAMEAVPVILE